MRSIAAIESQMCAKVLALAEYVQRFATKEAIEAADKTDEDDKDEEMSEVGSDMSH